jgi:hypothetical protein
VTILIAAGCGPEQPPPPEVDGPPVVVAAGDIADCATEVYNDDAYGVLQLTLRPKSYEWEFVPVKGEIFSDSGVTRCHRATSRGEKR